MDVFLGVAIAGSVGFAGGFIVCLLFVRKNPKKVAVIDAAISDPKAAAKKLVE